MKTISSTGIITVLAAAALAEGVAVGYDGALETDATAILGVCAAETDNGKYAPINVGRTAMVLLAGNVTAGTPLKTTTGGKFIDQAATGTIVGYALHSGGNGDLIAAKMV